MTPHLHSICISLGDILTEDFMHPHNHTAQTLAEALAIEPEEIHEVIHGRISLSPGLAMRLDNFFGMGEGYFLRLEAACNIPQLKEKV